MEFTIATWNINSLRVRLPQVLEWLQANPVDVLALQETKVIDDDFPLAEIHAAGYEVAFSGQKTYNGVATLHRVGTLEDIETDFLGFDDPQRRILAATLGEMRIINVYVPNGSEVGSEKYEYKLKWLAALEKYLQSTHDSYENIILLGDFNIAPRDEDVYDPEGWAGSVLVSDKERAALSAIQEGGMQDIFLNFASEGTPFSWWDYRQANFQRDRGLRIDLILCSDEMSEYCTECWVDRTPRGWERPSDHAPVIARFDWSE